METARVFDGKYYPDKVSRRLFLREGPGGPEAHLVPIEEKHLTEGMLCDCEPTQGVWGGHNVIYHLPDLGKIEVPYSMPERI
jgi:hypothetical protein